MIAGVGAVTRMVARPKLLGCCLCENVWGYAFLMPMAVLVRASPFACVLLSLGSDRTIMSRG